MNDRYRILVLTDHSIHSPWESIYPIAKWLSKSEACKHVHFVSRQMKGNQTFFQEPGADPVWAVKVTEEFSHSPSGASFHKDPFQTSVLNYDAVLLRLPRSSSMEFFRKIGKVIPPARMINQPEGIISTGDKRYLMNFPEFCPPMYICKTVDDVKKFAQQFPIVLKPFNNSGGNGIIKIDGDQIFFGNKAQLLSDYLPELERSLEEGMLGMKFLKNVTQGDKRIIVVNGEIVTASLRIPREGSWLANVSQGGSSEMSAPDDQELAIARGVVPDLLEKGVVLFGFDTLVDDHGKRILSELNTSCVNGIYPAEKHAGKPFTKITADLIIDYIQKHIYKDN